MRDAPDHGLTPRQVREIARVLAPWADRIDAVFLFGSRATGRHRPGSDVDLALHGRLGPEDLARIRMAFEDSDLPYLVDVVAVGDDTPPALRRHVDAVGQLLLSTADLRAAG